MTINKCLLRINETKFLTSGSEFELFILLFKSSISTRSAGLSIEDIAAYDEAREADFEDGGIDMEE
jgi:hypothetical protein